MRKVSLLVKDDFDVGSLISLLGKDLIAAHIGPYAKKEAPVETPEISLTPGEAEVIFTGRAQKEHTLPKGLTRKSAPRNRVPKSNGEKLLLGWLADGRWVTAKEADAHLQHFGYAKESAIKYLSHLAILERIERKGKRGSFQYRVKPNFALVG